MYLYRSNQIDFSDAFHIPSVCFYYYIKFWDILDRGQEGKKAQIKKLSRIQKIDYSCVLK